MVKPCLYKVRRSLARKL